MLFQYSFFSIHTNSKGASCFIRSLKAFISRYRMLMILKSIYTGFTEVCNIVYISMYGLNQA